MKNIIADPIDEMCRFAELGKMSCGLFHDILSPINGLSLYLERIFETDLTQRDNLVEPIRELSRDIGDFIRTVSQSIERPEKIEPEDLSQIVLKSVKLLHYRALRFGINISFEGPKYKIVTQDVLAWYQVLINLISNAIDSLSKKNSDRKEIIIRLKRRGPLVQLSIFDNGLGIEKKFLDRIFTLFFTTKEKGTGIGLYTVRRIIERTLHGKVFVASRAGLFARFVVRTHVSNFLKISSQ